MMINILRKIHLHCIGAFCSVFLFSLNVFCMNWSYVQYEAGVTQVALQPFIEQINSNEIGKNLLAKINELYIKAGAQCTRIVFKPGQKTSFSSRLVEAGIKIELVVEIANLTESFYPCLHAGRTAVISAISAESTPSWITLAHELIHLKHKLEEINKIGATGIQGIPYSLAKTIGISDILIGDYVNLSPYVPELLELRLNMSELWPNLEERRTVVGPDIDGICEASIRESAGLPSRFIYQDKNIKHLEKIATIENSFTDIPLSIVASVLTETDFCVFEDVVSSLTPIDILLSCGISEEKIIGNADNVPITFVTKNIFMQALKSRNTAGLIINPTMTELLGKILKHKPKPVVIEEW
jgi:hypothetical protein